MSQSCLMFNSTPIKIGAPPLANGPACPLLLPPFHSNGDRCFATEEVGHFNAQWNFWFSAAQGVLKTLLYFFTVWERAPERNGVSSLLTLANVADVSLQRLNLGLIARCYRSPLGGEAGGYSQLSIQRQVNHLLGNVFLLHSLCGLPFHLATWLVYNTTSPSSYWFLFPIPE